MKGIDKTFFDFVEQHRGDDPQKLLLKYRDKMDRELLDLAATQISARRKYVAKLGEFLDNSEFIIPDISVAEQASDWRVANYHAALVCGTPKLLEMTAGLGIDAFTMAMYVGQMDICELDPNRAEALKHNVEALGLHNVRVHNIDSTTMLDHQYDCIFIDPARRNADSRRFYSFADCQPDILSHIDAMLASAPRIFVKASPLLDIDSVLHDLPFTKRIRIVSVKNECKEVLVEILKDSNFEGVTAVDLDDEGIKTLFDIPSQELHDTQRPPIASLSDIHPGAFLYEPNASIMKISTAGNALCRTFKGLKKVSPNTSLYVSEEEIKDFPGRATRITALPDRQEQKRLRGERFNVATRNYPLSAPELAKKLKTRDGSNRFLYGFRAGTDATPVIAITEPIT